MQDLEDKIVLHASEKEFNETPRKTLYKMYLVGWKQDNGLIFVEKNRFNGKTGTYTVSGWKWLVTKIKDLFDIPDSIEDIEDMTREQLIGQIMKLRKEKDRLEDQISNMDWKYNGDSMGGSGVWKRTDEWGNSY